MAAGSIEVAKVLILQLPGFGLKLLVAANLILAAIWIAAALRIGALNSKLMQPREVG